MDNFSDEDDETIEYTENPAVGYLLDLDLIREWKNETEIENNVELLKDITIDLVHKYGSPKFPKFCDEIVKGIQELFILHYSKASEDHRRTLLKLIGILPYDENAASVLFSDEIIEILLIAAGLSPDTIKVDGFRVVFEAVRSLHHALHVSDKTQNIFIEKCEEVLFERMKACLAHLKEDEEVSQKPQFYFLNNASEVLIEELLYSDLRLAFVSCLSSPKLQRKWINDLSKANLFLDVLKYCYQKMSDNQASYKKITKKLMVVQTLPWTVEIIDDEMRDDLDEGAESLVLFQSFEMAITALEVLHHLHMYADIFSMVFAQNCANECAKIIESSFVDDDLKRVAARFLTAVPACLLPLCPRLSDSNNSKTAFEHFEMKFVAAVLAFLSKKLADSDPIEIRLLTSFFVVLIHLCSKHKQARRFCRSKLIPSIDNSATLDKELRTKILKLIITAKTFCAKQAAEFLFILCKRSISKLIKDTGVKNAADLLPENKDIFRKREGDSEDSDEENNKPKKVPAPPKKEPENKEPRKVVPKPEKIVSKLPPRMPKTEEQKTRKLPKSEIVPEMVKKYSDKI